MQNIISDILDFITFDVTFEISNVNIIYIQFIATFFIGLLGLFLIFRLTRVRKRAGEAKIYLNPILLLLIGYTLFDFTLALLNLTVALSNFQLILKYSLVFSPLILMILAQKIIVTSIIRTPSYKRLRVQRILKLINFTLGFNIIFSLLIFIEDILIMNVLLLFYYGLFLSVTGLVVVLLRHEILEDQPKLQRARVKLLYYTFLSIFLSLLLAIIGNLIPLGTTEFQFVIFILLAISLFLNLAILLFSYWTYFVPVWFRRREKIPFYHSS